MRYEIGFCIILLALSILIPIAEYSHKRVVNSLEGHIRFLKEQNDRLKKELDDK